MSAADPFCPRHGRASRPVEIPGLPCDCGPPPLPHHRFDVRIHVGANRWEDAVAELRRVADHVAEHGPKCTSVSGGVSGVHAVLIVEDPEVTDESYAAELERWTAERRRP